MLTLCGAMGLLRDSSLVIFVRSHVRESEARVPGKTSVSALCACLETAWELLEKESDLERGGLDLPFHQ